MRAACNERPCGTRMESGQDACRSLNVAARRRASSMAGRQAASSAAPTIGQQRGTEPAVAVACGAALALWNSLAALWTLPQKLLLGPAKAWPCRSWRASSSPACSLPRWACARRGLEAPARRAARREHGVLLATPFLSRQCHSVRMGAQPGLPCRRGRISWNRVTHCEACGALFRRCAENVPTETCLVL